MDRFLIFSNRALISCLRQTSLISLLVYVASGFVSSTVHSIALILGLSSWGLQALLANRQRALSNSTGRLANDCTAEEMQIEQLDSSTCYDPRLKLFNYLILGQLAVMLLVKIVHGETALDVLAEIVGVYLPWFWFSGLLGVLARDHYRQQLDWVILAATVMSGYIFLQLLGFIAPVHHQVFGIQKQPFTSSGVFLATSFITLYMRDYFYNPGVELDSEGQVKSLFTKIANALRLKLADFYLFLFMLQAISIFALSQLSAMTGFVMGVLIYLLVNIKKILRETKFQTLLASVASIAFAIVGIFTFSKRFKRKFSKLLNLPDFLANNKSFECRLELWQSNWQHFLNAPLMGQKDIIPLQCLKSTLTHMHSIYWQHLVKTGLLGLSVWGLFMIALFYELLRKLRYSSAPFLGGLVAFCIEGLMENWWGDSEVYSAFLLLIIAALQLTHPSKKFFAIS